MRWDPLKGQHAAGAPYLLAKRGCFLSPHGQATLPRVLDCKQGSLTIRKYENFAGLRNQDLHQGTEEGKDCKHLVFERCLIFTTVAHHKNVPCGGDGAGTDSLV